MIALKNIAFRQNGYQVTRKAIEGIKKFIETKVNSLFKSDMSWKGAKSGSTGAQAYYTSPELAESVTRIAKRFPGPYCELGVGAGALYSKLPTPKMGVEIQAAKGKVALSGVTYSTDALKWVPSRRAGVVVMNPPFARQIAFFNHACSFTDVIVWIAGQNIRLWMNEDLLDHNMQCFQEWLVPPEWSNFTTATGSASIPVVVQVWKRTKIPRALWNLKSIVKLCPDQMNPPRGAWIIKRVGLHQQVGSVQVMGRDCKITRRTGDVIETTNGTLAAKLGTSMCVLDPVTNLTSRKQNDIIRDLLRYRSSSRTMVSLTRPILSAIVSPNWRRLIRPITYLDGKTRSTRQW